MFQPNYNNNNPNPNPNSNTNNEQVTWHTTIGDIVPRPWGYSVQKPYNAERDWAFLTGVLINAGYRPYNLHRADTDTDETVWAKANRVIVGWKTEKVHDREVQTEPITEDRLPDLTGIMVGEVTELPMNGRVVEVGDTILHGALDGGMINEGGHLKPELAKPR